MGSPSAQTEERKKAILSLSKAYHNEQRLCALDFWYWARNVITEDEDQKKNRQFPLDYEYLIKLHHTVEKKRRVIVLKSRRLLVSWYGMLRQLYQAMMAGSGLEACPPVYRGGVMSIGETEAKYLMQRIKRTYRKMPQWMKDYNPLVRENELMLEFRNGGVIQAFALKREGPQTFGFSEVFFDEMALQDAVRTVWTGLLPTLGADGRLLAVSTPNGKGNLFYDVWSNKENNYAGIERVQLHWSENPEHDEAWFKMTTAGMDKQMIARMFELSFAAYFGQPVWPTFDRRTHVVDETDVIDNSPMYIGHDFGYHFPAVTFWQRNSRDQWVGHAEYSGFDMSTEDFYAKAIEFANTFYDRKRIPEIHCVPPDGLQRYRSRSISGAINDIGHIKSMFKVPGRKVQVRVGPNQVGERINEGPRLKEFRPLWKLRADGMPGIQINKGMEIFIEGCQGGYSYPEKAESEEPLKNEYSHLQDSAQAVVVAYNRMFHMREEKADPILRQRRRIGYRTGL